MSSLENEQQTISPDEDDKALMYALQLVSGSVLPMTLKAAIQLGILDIINDDATGKLSAEEIVAKLPTDNPQAAATVDRLLRLLASYNVVSCVVETHVDGSRSRKYGRAPVTKFLTNSSNGSVANLGLWHQDRVLMESWYHLKDVVLEGGVPFERAHGMPIFDHHATVPRLNKIFNDAMYNSSIPLINKFLDVYDGFENVSTFVDVGGGTGVTVQMVTSKYPHIKGVNFDRPHVVSDAPAALGVEHIGGDMFEFVPEGDIVFLKWILHDWRDEDCVKILKNCWKSVKENGKVIVMDIVLQELPNHTPVSQYLHHIDLIMLAYNPGGRERTREEVETLAKQAGFSSVRATYIFANNWIIELVK